MAMERDFLGLNLKDSFSVVKEEVKDGSSRDSAFMKGTGMQWSFSNKVSALPQFMSFKAVQEDRHKKIVFDPLTSSGFMPVSTAADAFDTNNKAAASITLKNFNLSRQGGTHYAMTAYPVQHVDAHSAHRPQEMKMFSVSNPTISVAMGNPFFKTHVGTAGQNLSATTMKQQPLGGIPVTAPYSILPTVDPMAGINDPRNTFKSPGPPAQLTIFYAGGVTVYDDVSPEKAQAIMFLAGNGSSMTSNTTNPRAQVQGPTQKPVAGDGVLGNQSHSTSPCSGLSSPLSVTSHPGPQSGSGSSSTDELMATKPVGALATPNSQPESPKMVSSLGSTSATLMPSAVPQARKASLARFLEKRKERVMSTAPYSPAKKFPDSAATGSDGISFSGSYGATTVPLPVSKDQSWCMGGWSKNEGSTTNLQTTLEI